MSSLAQVNRLVSGAQHPTTQGQTGQGRSSILLPDPPRFPVEITNKYPQLRETEEEWITWRNQVQAQLPVPTTTEAVANVDQLLVDPLSRLDALDTAIIALKNSITVLGKNHSTDLSDIEAKIADLQAQINAFKSSTFYLHTQSDPLSTWTVHHNLGRMPSVTLMDDNYNIVIAQVQNGFVTTVFEFTATRTGHALFK